MVVKLDLNSAIKEICKISTNMTMWDDQDVLLCYLDDKASTVRPLLGDDDFTNEVAIDFTKQP